MRSSPVVRFEPIPRSHAVGVPEAAHLRDNGVGVSHGVAHMQSSVAREK